MISGVGSDELGCGGNSSWLVGWRLLEVGVDGKVDLAGNSIVKNLVEETSLIWAPKKEVSARFWIRLRPQDF
jgi:hypothetical protein